MNTYFDYLAVACLFLFPYLLAIVAFREIRDRELASVKDYMYRNEYPWIHRWHYSQVARFVSGLRWQWPFMGLSSRWFLEEGNSRRSLVVIPWKDFGDSGENGAESWYKDDERHLLVKHPNRTVVGWLLVIDFLLVGLLTVALWFNAHPDAFSARSAATPVATQVAAIPTIQIATPRPQPTATPELEVEVTDSGTAIVIDLDQQAPASALLEWINGLPGPNLPALPSALEDWLNSLPWPEVAAIQLPEGMDGYVVVARRGDGFELVRLDENGNLVGSPVAFKDTKEFTLHARELKWGVRYSSKFRVTNESQGHIDVYVAESGEPSMAVGYHLYNFRWWHIAVVIVLIIIGVVAYRRIYY